ncbi:hypothetical protein TWF281_010464 [Arthrobotrys megalospora]
MFEEPGNVAWTDGSLTFGGIDVAKFNNSQLTTYRNKPENYNRIKLRRIELLENGKPYPVQEWNPQIEADVDFGDPSIRLPKDFLARINKNSEQYSEAPGLRLQKGENGTYILSKPPATDIHVTTSGLRFSFDKNLTIFVPFQQMMSRKGLEMKNEIPLMLTESGGTAADVTLGAPFFRSAYVFFDFDHDQLAIAPAVPNSLAQQHILEVGANGTPFDWEQLSRVLVPPTVTQSPTITPTATTAPTSNSPTSETIEPLPIIIAASVPGGLLLIALGVIGWLLLRRRREKPQAHVRLEERHSSWDEFFSGSSTVVPSDPMSENAPIRGDQRSSISRSSSHRSIISRRSSSYRPSGRPSLAQFEFELAMERPENRDLRRVEEAEPVSPL